MESPLIVDEVVVTSLRAEWAGVLRMQDRMKLLVTATFAGGAFTAPALSNVVYNLPLLLAFDVLRQVLMAARRQGAFSCARGQLGELMDGARTEIPWVDWHALREGVRRRNAIAHDGELFDATQCIRDIERIEIQIREWHLL